MKEDIFQCGHRSTSYDPLKAVEDRIARWVNGKGTEKTDSLRRDMQSLMMDYASVFRDEKGLKKGIEEIRSLKDRYQYAWVADKGRAFNYELLETIELGHQMDLSEVILLSALQRQESRGAHFRMDYPHRDDQNFLKHTLVLQTPKGLEVRYKPVRITRFQPQARVY